MQPTRHPIIRRIHCRNLDLNRPAGVGKRLVEPQMAGSAAGSRRLDVRSQLLTSGPVRGKVEQSTMGWLKAVPAASNARLRVS